MPAEKPIAEKEVLLKKFEGKGGWTYAEIPGIKKTKRNPFGWLKVKGSIDGYSFVNYHLMPMKNGNLFLAVKSEIRKKINKKAGDKVFVILFEDNAPTLIPDELLLCFENEPSAYKGFLKFSDSEKKAYIDWIYAAKKIETKTDRITKMLQRSAKELTLYDFEKY